MTESAIKNSPLVSVIINCFNGEKYLHEAIDSVISQSYTNWEIIFWDNMSTDGSADIVNSFNDKRIKYYYAETHTVLYEARNKALEKVNGEYIAFLDCDDIWQAEKLEKQLKLFDNDNVGFVCSNYHIINSKNEIIKENNFNYIPNDNVFEELSINYCVGLLTLIIKKNVLEKNKITCDPDYNIVGDFDLVMKLAMLCKMNSTQESLAFYRNHETNESLNNKLLIDEKKLFLTKNKEKLFSYNKKGFYFIEQTYYVQKIKYLIKSKLFIKALFELLNLRLLILLNLYFRYKGITKKISISIPHYKN